VGSWKSVGRDVHDAARRANASRLDERVSAQDRRWHQHVNWCMPPKGKQGRWAETKNGMAGVRPGELRSRPRPSATSRGTVRAGAVRVDGARQRVFRWMISGRFSPTITGGGTSTTRGAVSSPRSRSALHRRRSGKSHEVTVVDEFGRVRGNRQRSNLTEFDFDD